MKGPRKLKPSTRIDILRRDLKTTRSMLEIAGAKFFTFASEIDRNVAGARAGLGRVLACETQLARDMREISSECARIAGVCNGW